MSKSQIELKTSLNIILMRNPYKLHSTQRKGITVSPYLNSPQKQFLDLILAFALFIIILPLFATIGLLIILTSGLPVFFTQIRVGKAGKTFVLYKFRTMKSDAHRQQSRFQHLNTADGPVFKIKDDPRFVGIGKWLANTGLDELPQLINVIQGDMSLVGPRPLPVSEAKNVPKKYQARKLIKPGITSSWAVQGSHHLKFSQWMKLDLDYIQTANLNLDVQIFIKTVTTMTRLILNS